MPLPVLAVPALNLAGSLSGKLFGLFRLGHADDAVDQAEDQFLQSFVIPIVSQATGKSVPFSWVETDRLIGSINAANTPLTGQEAASFITQGDQAVQELCASFQQQGFPCGGKPGYAGGAGRDIPRTWGLLRAKLTEIRTAKGGVVSSLLGGGGILSKLLGGGTPGPGGTVQAGFLQNNTVLIGAALIAAWLLAYKMGERK